MTIRGFLFATFWLFWDAHVNFCVAFSNAPPLLSRRVSPASNTFLYQSFNNYDNNNDDEEYRIPLDLEIERQIQLRMEAPIATLTWFDLEDDETSEDGARFLKERAREVVKANPWLESGRIEGRPGDTELVFEQNLYEPDIEIVSVKDAQRLVKNGSDRPIEGEIYQMILKYIKIDEAQGPLWRISVVPAYGQFGLIFAVSHKIVDVHAYYKLYDMLTCRDQKIGSLDINEPYVETDDGEYAYSDEQAIFFVGGPRIWKLIHSPWQLIKGAYGIIERNIWRKFANGPFKSFKIYDDDDQTVVDEVRTKVETQGVDYWFEIDMADLQLVKDVLILEETKDDDLSYLPQWDEVDQFERLKGGDRSQGRFDEAYHTPPTFSSQIQTSSGYSPQRPYISTNDVLSAWFFQTAKCRLGLICCNYRGKLKGHYKYLGRNYWGAYALTSDQFEDPFAVREQIQRPVVSKDEFPKLAVELLEPKPLGIVSSWTLPSKALPYFEPKEHWPLYDFATSCPANFVVLRTWWIQRPSKVQPGRIGVYVAGDANWLLEPLEFNDKVPSFLFEL